jgi:hypothetical protein
MNKFVMAAAVLCLLAQASFAAPSDGESIDLLKLADPARDAVQDTWTRTPEGLSCDTGSGARFSFPELIEGSYDLDVEFTRVKGDEDVNTIFPVGLYHGCIMLSGFLEKGSISALDLVDGHWAVDAAHPSRRVPGKLENGHSYHLAIRVRLLANDRVSVDTLLDDKPYLPRWEGNQSALKPRPEWALPTPKRIGLGVWKSRVVFHSVRLRMISGHAELDYAATSLRDANVAVAPGTDPIDWTKPAQVPGFREQVTGDEFKRQFDKAAAQIDIGALEKSKRTHAGSRIVMIKPDSQGEHLRLHLGDTIVSVNGKQSWDEDLDRRGEVQETMTYLTKEGDIRNVEIEPGLLGVGCIFEWSPEMLYIRGDRRDSRWDKLVLVAILARNSNPDLAETALHQAVSAGYKPDLLTAGIAAEIALEQGRPEAAADFAYEAREADPTLPAQVYPQLLYRVAVANYKLDAAVHILSDYYGALPARAKTLNRLIAMHRARLDAERRVPPPSELVGKMRHVDLFPRMSATDPAMADWVKQVAAHGPPFDLIVPTAQYTAIGFQPKPAVRDVEVVARFTCRASDAADSEYGKILEIGLFQGAPAASDDLFSGGGNPPLLVAGISPKERNVNFSHSGSPGTRIYYHDPLVRADGSQLIELRLLRIDGQAEMFINRRRVLYVPVDQKQENVGLLMKAVGVTAEVKEFHVDELVPAK